MKRAGQRPHSRPANLTSKQADAAVKNYLRKQPYSEAGLRRVPCRQCGKPSEHQWNLRPCALGSHAWYGLCREHGLELNGIVVEFLRVPNGAEILEAYAATGAAPCSVVPRESMTSILSDPLDVAFDLAADPPR